MKKARIMLAVIAILGIVGGSLAFKAQKFFGGDFWYATTTQGPASCYSNGTTVNVPRAIPVPIAFTSTTTTTIFGTSFFYTHAGVTVYCINPTTMAFLVPGE